MYRKSFEDVDAYITGLTLANFKSFVEPTRIDFAPITLFFGPNSSGKSTVYSAIALLEKLLTLGYFSGWEAPELLAYIHKREDDHQAYITTHLHSDSFSHPIYAVDSKSPIDLSIDSYESLFPNKSDFLHSRIGRSGFDVDVTYSLRHKDHSYWSLEEIKFQQESLVTHRYFETKFNLNNVFFEHVEKDLARYDLSFLSLITRLFPQENTALDGNILITELEIHIDKTDVSYMALIR
ncbi:AAA family ATPase [Thiorhodovibrio frisius]|uniref:Rad50/SbcC-type AAA domain-containing protein n=1 Tax=Thiorhodovibrio frisius TaxID=631362 RepID=H8Z7B1_9GAMM|nr:AAA family ATPase [Thiorhodovibrio frisius]EIC19827.1 hypothetical protein Thi970DRAFT_03431 [Thiorhodovibrio frisius]WPL20555.1 chromosome segregation protein SMC [Thiorhodovibrio frisius]